MGEETRENSILASTQEPWCCEVKGKEILMVHEPFSKIAPRTAPTTRTKKRILLTRYIVVTLVVFTSSQPVSKLEKNKFSKKNTLAQ